MTNQRGVISLEVGWDRMQTGLKKLELILEGKNPGLQFSSEEYMESYTVVYNMCTQKHPYDYSMQLYDKYKEVLDSYITSTVLPSLTDKHGELFLREVVLRWSTHTIMVRWLSRFFHYLDRYFTVRRSLPPLKTVGITCFKDLVYDTQLRKGMVSREIIHLIDREREGEKVDHAVLKNAVDIYVGIGLESMDAYEEDFEAALLADTGDYYSRKASRWIVQDSCPEYMVKAEECLKKEKDRVGHYLHSTTESKLLDKAQHELLTKVSSQLLDKEHSGCRALLRDDKVEDLSRMYRLFSRIPNKGLDPVAATFKQHVSEEGAGIVKQAEDAASNKKEYSLIRKLIDLHDKYFDYVVTCFANSSLFHKSLKEAFEMFCNKTVADNSTAELLASFCDNILRGGGSEKLGEEAVEETLEKVVRLLAFISDKDLFAEFARKKLARRLLNDKGYNEDHERGILSKLKQNYGGQFTSKMEGMVIDITLAKETNTGFVVFCGSSSKALVDGVHLTVSVLTTGFWPTYKSSDINLPAEMVKCVEKFKEHYHTKTKHRKLTWIHSMGSCTVNGKFDAKDIELVVSPYQACLLLLFNSSHKLSFQEIVTQLNLSEDDVLRALHALSCHKYKILTKEPSTKSISATDVFEFNPKFNDKMRRIKVPNPPVADEKKKVVEDVGKDRRYAIDAALVRIMKSRKVLAYQQLVMECVEQLSRMFKPDVRIVKKRIEDLITRDYLERDAENPNTFKYLA